MIRHFIAAALILALVGGATKEAAACQGDCGGDGEVTVDDLILSVNISLGAADVGQCPSVDTSNDGEVTVDEIIGAVNSALSGCAEPAVPTPTPTATPEPSPISSCADGFFRVAFADARDTNANTATLDLGKVTAVDQIDPSSNTYIWVISGNVCTAVPGEPARAIALQGIGQPDRIKAGAYAVASPVPPFLSLSYMETKVTLDPTQNFIHNWAANGGTLVLEDAGGGALRFHASGVTMAKGLVFHGATGTFTLDVTGTITRVTHN